jgi:hypothetical protein
VRYAKQKNDHVARWAVGEEVWGNGGIPGINFEPDGVELLGRVAAVTPRGRSTDGAPPAQTPFRPYWALRPVGAMTRHGGPCRPTP